eukprot:Hpha_TRINITY_DN15930_c2_g4::TRINITY_DN15930_c2_g4_i1::g.74706::m.74706
MQNNRTSQPQSGMSRRMGGANKGRWERAEVVETGSEPKICVRETGEVIRFAYRQVRCRGPTRALVQIGDRVTFTRKGKKHPGRASQVVLWGERPPASDESEEIMEAAEAAGAPGSAMSAASSLSNAESDLWAAASVAAASSQNSQNSKQNSPALATPGVISPALKISPLSSPGSKSTVHFRHDPYSLVSSKCEQLCNAEGHSPSALYTPIRGAKSSHESSHEEAQEQEQQQ